MYDFDFWYAYFDSLFTKPKIALNPSFISTYPLENIFIDSILTNFSKLSSLNAKNYLRFQTVSSNLTSFLQIRILGSKATASNHFWRKFRKTSILPSYWFRFKKSTEQSFGILREESKLQYATFSPYLIFFLIPWSPIMWIL